MSKYEENLSVVIEKKLINLYSLFSIEVSIVKENMIVYLIFADMIKYPSPIMFARLL